MVEEKKAVNVGWLQQDIGILGGSEMSCSALIQGAPDWAKVIPCPPNKRPSPAVDIFVIQNCVPYDDRWIDPLSQKPVIKHVRDPWYAGNAMLRRWLLDNAKLLIFSSKMQHRYFGYKVGSDVVFIPPPVNLEFFRAAALPDDERRGAVFVGRTDIFKGIGAAIDWAMTTGEQLLIIGDKSYMNGMSFGQLPENIKVGGIVDNRDMPQILGIAKTFVFYPEWPEAFGRTVVEAWAAGCKLQVGNRIGAMEWINDRPNALGYDNAIRSFWDQIESVAISEGVLNE